MVTAAPEFAEHQKDPSGTQPSLILVRTKSHVEDYPVLVHTQRLGDFFL
jgi:hypothetical protein